MALDLGDLEEVFDASMLVKIKGTQYRIPPVSAELGLWIRGITALRMQVPDKATPRQMAAALAKAEQQLGPPPIPEGQTFEEALLSPPVVAQMVADGVSQQEIEHLAQVAQSRVVGGDELAKVMFRGDDPNRPSPANRLERRAATKAVTKAVKAVTAKGSGSRTTSTAGAATTRTRASGSTTKSPRKTAAPAKAAGSRGGKSSSGGRS